MTEIDDPKRCKIKIFLNFQKNLSNLIDEYRFSYIYIMIFNLKGGKISYVKITKKGYQIRSYHWNYFA